MKKRESKIKKLRKKGKFFLAYKNRKANLLKGITLKIDHKAAKVFGETSDSKRYDLIIIKTFKGFRATKIFDTETDSNSQRNDLLKLTRDSKRDVHIKLIYTEYIN